MSGDGRRNRVDIGVLPSDSGPQEVAVDGVRRAEPSRRRRGGRDVQIGHGTLRWPTGVSCIQGGLKIPWDSRIEDMPEVKYLPRVVERRHCG
jgi:hypothetical protein